MYAVIEDGKTYTAANVILDENQKPVAFEPLPLEGNSKHEVVEAARKLWGDLLWNKEISVNA